jgi:hypothetical protein
MWNAGTLGAKLLDPDEKVRAAVCKLYSQLDYETALHHVSEAQLRRVAERGLDKKVTCSCHYFILIIHEFSVHCPGRGPKQHWETLQSCVSRDVSFPSF